ncbi:MAG: SRPBCC family protein [Gaiellaceae bacterium]
MAPIVHSVEISRSPEDVFAYLTDFSRSSEWQENLVSASVEGGDPLRVGSHVKMTRRIGRSERKMTNEVIEHNPPRSFGFRGIDGPIRAIGKGTVEPVGDGARSRFTMELDFEGRGIGKLLVPLVVRRQARSDMAKSQERLKARLESGGT